ncbi:MAG: VOC family protein [Acidobacteria bacterium]|nr:VOC family protein [Acidobacteriota bacterium]
MTTKVKPIPEGYHTITPYIVVRDAARAIDFYKRAFGALELMRSLSPDGKSIMHAELKIGDSIFMLNDEFPAWKVLSPESLGGSSTTLYLYVADADATYNQAVAAGATVAMPIMDAFWGDRCGQIVDPFGHKWSVATHKLDLTPEEIHKAGAVAMAQMSKEKGCGQ